MYECLENGRTSFCVSHEVVFQKYVRCWKVIMEKLFFSFILRDAQGHLIIKNSALFYICKVSILQDPRRTRQDFTQVYGLCV